MKARSSRLGAICIAICIVTLICSAAVSSGQQPVKPTAPPAVEPEYATPLAGERCTIRLFDQTFEVSPRDRANVLAFTLGGTLFLPAVGSTDGLPVAAAYWRRENADTRTRLIFSVFVNELDHAVKYGNWELLGHLENNTVPFPSAEIENGVQVAQSSIVWGQAAAWIGGGYRLPVAPFQIDNDLRLQLFYEGGYLYSGRTADTGSQVKLPPDTYVHGLRLRTRYDGMRRNLMELLHNGFAAGMDLEWQRRAHWSDASYSQHRFSRDETQEYIKLSGYLMHAGKFPGLSQRDRLILSLHGGTAPGKDLDRYAAFRIGGGPFPSETDDLARILYPGAQFNQFPVSDYAISAVEYRRELLPFLFMHLRGTFAWADRDVLTSQHSFKLQEPSSTLSVGLTTGLPWDSSLYLEYSHDDGILRNGPPGDNLLMLWSKSL